MPTTETRPAPAMLKRVRTVCNHAPEKDSDQLTAQATLSLLFPGHRSLEAPWLTRVYISGTAGLGVTGLIKSLSPRGLHVVTPIRVPIQRNVLITIAGCCTVPVDVVYCVKKSPVFHVGIVLLARPKPDVPVGAVATIRELEESCSVSRGFVMEVGRGSLLMLCKTKLTPNSRVRVESNRWVMFGEVEGVAASGMVASSLAIRLYAVLPAQFARPVFVQQAQSDIAEGQVGKEQK